MSSPNDPPLDVQPPIGKTSRSASWSLRNELIASHAGLVALVVLGFGTSLYGMMLWATYRQAETDLLGAAQMLVQSLADHESTASLAISETYLHRFGKAPRDHAYFAVWDSDGQLVAGTNPLPMHAVRSQQPVPRHGPHPFIARADGQSLDVIVATPQGGQLLIGRPLAKEFDALGRMLLRIVLIGLACLVLGSVGAWWLARRLSRPIVRMAETAQRVTSRNLTDRLDVDGTAREITQLATAFNTMLAGLHNSFERQIRFTADASHELRTPVSIVLSQAEHTLSRERSVDDYREALRTCLRSALRMKKLVDDLLLLARADSGRLDLHLEKLDLSEVVRNVVQMLQPLAATNGIRVEVDLQPTMLSGDATRLGQVVTNLVTNAVQYNLPGGDVSIDVRPSSDTAVLIVRDHGLGIPLADQPRLFDRFYRVERARTHEEDTGTGLGLSLVAEIVAAHQGTIQVTSIPGEGTTMTVRIPALDSSGDAAAISSHS